MTFARQPSPAIEAIIRKGVLQKKSNAQMAREIGCHQDSISRYKAAMGYSEPQDEGWVYKIGYELRTWHKIVSDARWLGDELVAQQYDVPVGAIESFRQGRWELID